MQQKERTDLISMTPWEERKRGDTTGFAIVAALVAIGAVWAVTHFRAKDPRQSSLQSPRGKSMAILAAGINPNLEVVAFDQPLGTISMRDRTDGKVILYHYSFDLSKREFSITAPDGTGMKFKAGVPGRSSLEMRYPELSVKTGEAADRSTGWIPMYPDAIPQSIGSITGKSEIAHILSFVTQDDVEKVRSVYARLFTEQGFTTTTTETEPGLLAAEAESGKHNIQIRATRQGELTHVIVYAVEKQ